MSIETNYPAGIEENFSPRIFCKLRQIVREEEIDFRNKTTVIEINDLKTGVYSLSLKILKIQNVKNFWFLRNQAFLF